MAKRIPVKAADSLPGGTTPPRYALIPMSDILEPEMPAREKMNVEALDELADSLRTIGLKQPIILEEHTLGFQIVAGHRRFLAARSLNWATIPAMVYQAGTADVAATMLHENVVREELNSAEEAVWFMQLIERYELDEAGICKLVKRTPAYIADRLNLARGDEKIFEATRDGLINLSVARLLNRFPTEEFRRYYLDCAIRAGTCARVVEGWLRDFKAQSGGPVSESGQFVTQAETLAEQVKAVDRPACLFCGGSLDPYNLVSVFVHKWELAHVKAMLDTRADMDHAPAGAPGGENGQQ